MTRPRLPNRCRSCGDPCQEETCRFCLHVAFPYYGADHPSFYRCPPQDRSNTAHRRITDDEQGRPINLDSDLEHMTEDQP